MRDQLITTCFFLPSSPSSTCDLVKPISYEHLMQKFPPKMLLSKDHWVNRVTTNFCKCLDLRQAQDLKFTPALCVLESRRYQAW